MPVRSSTAITWGFGTGIVPKGWGFTLQNRGHNFSLDPDHPNALAPRKRPYHTIIPAMVTRVRDRIDSLYASYGVMGGFMQPQGHVQVLSALVDDGLDPQAALDLPRFCIDVEEAGGRVALEEGIPPETISGLEKMGHPVYSVSGYDRSLFGRGQVILRDPETGVLMRGQRSARRWLCDDALASRRTDYSCVSRIGSVWSVRCNARNPMTAIIPMMPQAYQSKFGS